MPKAASSPNRFTNTIKHKFEEVPLFWHFVAGTPWRAARLDGEFEVSFGDDDNWHISDVWIETDNGRIGSAAEGKTINLNADDHEAFYWMVLTAIEGQYKTRIDEWVRDEINGRPSRRAA